MQTETLNIFLVIFAGLNIVLLIFALRVVWKYTKEIEVVGKYMGEIEKIRQALTRQSEELANQRRLSVLPTLAAWLKQDESGSPIHRLYLKNVGNGIAMNIEIARIDFVTSVKDGASPDVNFAADRGVLRAAVLVATAENREAGVDHAAQGHSLAGPDEPAPLEEPVVVVAALERAIYKDCNHQLYSGASLRAIV